MSEWDDDKSTKGRKPGPFESEMDSFDEDEFGGPLFGATTEQPAVGFDDDKGEPLSFGSDDSGALPHWTDPPTGEVPRIDAAEAAPDPTEDVDVWSSFAGSATSDDAAVEAPKDPTGELSWHDDPTVDGRAGCRGGADVRVGAGHRGRRARSTRTGTHHHRDRPIRHATPSGPQAPWCGTATAAEPRCVGPGGRWSQPSRRRCVGARPRRSLPGLGDVATGSRLGVRHGRARSCFGRVLRPGHRQGIPARDGGRCGCMCRCAAGRLLGG